MGGCGGGRRDNASGAFVVNMCASEIELSVQGVRVVLGDASLEPVVLERHAVPNKLCGCGLIGGVEGWGGGWG